MDDTKLAELYSEARELTEAQKVSKSLIDRVEKLVAVAEQRLVAEPRGLIFRRCPQCNRRLKAQSVDVGGTAFASYYKCDCGYEYAWANKSF